MNRGPELSAPSELIAKKRLAKIAAGIGVIVAAAVGVSSIGHSAEAALPQAFSRSVEIINGTLYVNDQPFFIESIFRPCESDVLLASRELGVNTIIESSCGPDDLKKIAKIAQDYNMYVIGTYGSGNRLADMPNLIGLSLEDEPDDTGSGRPYIRPPFVWTPVGARKNNPDGLPLFQNYTNRFAADTPPPPGASKDIYKSYVNDVDAISFDQYYWNTYSCHDLVRPNSFFYETRDLVALAAGQKLVTAFVEVNNVSPQYSCPNAVNPSHVHNQIMQAVAAGAKGINLFTHDWRHNYFVPHDIAAGINTTFSKMGPLKKIILEGVPLKFSNVHRDKIVYGSWAYNGSIYVEAVNTEETPASTVIKLPKLTGKLSLTANLGPLESRLYTFKASKQSK